MGKTETIKERRVDVYLDSLERKERWNELADEADESLSTFVQQCVKYAIKQGGPDFAEIGEQSKQIQELEKTIDELREDIKQKEIVIEKLENEVRQHRVEPFLQDEFEGTREYDEELIEILQNTNRIAGDELLRRLDIDPSETELVKGVDQQLKQLEAYGLIRNTPQGWVWSE